MHTVSILGLGRAGGSLAVALDRSGVPIEQLIFNSHAADLSEVNVPQIGFTDLQAVRGDILVIATPDQKIFPVATQLAGLRAMPKFALHLSGSLSSGELHPLRSRGVAVGSMHPLVSISDAIAGADRFEGAYFCVEGDEAAVEAASDLVDALGGKPFTIDSEFKPLYHASAVMASGNVTALFDAAIEILAKCGLERAEAHKVLLPLLQSAVANLNGHSTQEALTGPFVRGDVDALLRHLAAFEGTVDDDIRRAYLLLAGRSVEIAARSRATETEALAEAISMAKRKSGC